MTYTFDAFTLPRITEYWDVIDGVAQQQLDSAMVTHQTAEVIHCIVSLITMEDQTVVSKVVSAHISRSNAELLYQRLTEHCRSDVEYHLYSVPLEP